MQMLMVFHSASFVISMQQELIPNVKEERLKELGSRINLAEYLEKGVVK